MDQSTLVEAQIDEGRRFVERFAADGAPVRAAFWAQTDPDGFWYLYVALAGVEHTGTSEAYRAARKSLQKLGDIELKGSWIKIVGPDHSVAEGVVAITAANPSRSGTRYGGQSFGPMSVEHLYVYPSQLFTFTQANPMTTEEVGHEILRLMNRGPGVLQPARITLEDGITFNGVPFSFSLGSQNAVVVSFIADGEAAPRVVRLDEIASVM